MFTTRTINPLNLVLDNKNPRFRINTNPTQDEIRNYMLKHEKAIRLATKMVEMNTLLPGERIIIYFEDETPIVLEGNRRTCVYQMLLNRQLIPAEYASSFPVASETFLTEISNLSVDVVSNRQDAMAYLAARHIEGVEKWSAVSKWKVSYECFRDGKTIQEISNYLILPANTVKTNICNYKVLLRGIEKPQWTQAEKARLSPLEIKPNKLIRILRLTDTTSRLGFYFNDNYDLKSRILSDVDIDEIIKILTRKAFIDNTLNTRSSINDVWNDISHLISSDPNEVIDTALVTQDEQVIEQQESNQNSNVETSQTITQQSNTPFNNNGNRNLGTGGSANLPYFFTGVQFGHLSSSDPSTHGVCRICNELKLFSERRLVRTYPISAAFLTRSIIEQSFTYYAKKTNIQGQQRLIWDKIVQDRKDDKLSKIVENYKNNLNNYITDQTMRDYFSNLFSNYNDTANPLNWVVHRPHEFVMVPDALSNLPSQGLLSLINYLIR